MMQVFQSQNATLALSAASIGRAGKMQHALCCPR